MHLIESYATNCGVKIDKPEIYQSYYPLPYEKYIVFQPFSKPAKNYSYWQEVIDVIHPILSQNNIHIVQIGGPNEKPFHKVECLAGKLNINQTAYVINNSLLTFGTDSFALHFAGSFGINTLGLYSNSNPKNVEPYWKANHKSISQSLNLKPSYSLDENPKSIDTIKIEEIVNGILEQLGINLKFKYNTQYIGRAYHAKTLEMVPDCLINPKDFGVSDFIVRFDLLNEITEENYKFFIAQSQHSKLNIVTDKPLDIGVLNLIRSRINVIIYLIEHNHSIEFAKNLHKLGVPHQFCTFLDKESYEKYKIDFIDLGNIVEIHDPVTVDTNNTYYFKSSKYILSKGKMYPSDFAYRLGYSINSLDYDPIQVKLEKETIRREGKSLWLLTSS